MSRELGYGGLVWLLLAVTAAGRLAAAELSKSALEANPEGWVDLMPPVDLKGWSRVPVPAGAPLGRQQWHVEESGKVLVYDGDGGHDMLLCDREFRYTKVQGRAG
jgi:hypothetical protein